MSRYMFNGRCEQGSDIAIDDGVTRLFYNCCYGGDDITYELRKLYDYIETGKSCSSLTKRIETAVAEVGKVEEWRALNSKWLFV